MVDGEKVNWAAGMLLQAGPSWTSEDLVGQEEDFKDGSGFNQQPDSRSHGPQIIAGAASR